MARRDDGAYWAYVTEEQRRQPGCPARELCESLRFQGTMARLLELTNQFDGSHSVQTVLTGGCRASGPRPS